MSTDLARHFLEAMNAIPSDRPRRRLPGEDPDYVTAPRDYTELFEEYFGFITGMVVSLGIASTEADDVASEIMIRLVETDVLGQFDERLEFSHGGTLVKARFKSFLSAKVEHYVRGKRDRQATRSRREPLLCDKPVGDSGAMWVEVFGGSHSDDLTEVEMWETVQRIRLFLRSGTVFEGRWVDGMPMRGKRDLARLFDLIVVQIHADGNPKPNRYELAEDFGVSDTAIGSMMGDLKVALREVLAA